MSKAVQVGEDHRAQRRLSPGRGYDAFQLGFERAAVGQRGKHVGVAEDRLHLHRFGLLGDFLFRRFDAPLDVLGGIQDLCHRAVDAGQVRIGVGFDAVGNTAEPLAVALNVLH